MPALKLLPMNVSPTDSPIILLINGGFETGTIYVKGEYHPHIDKWGYYLNPCYYTVAAHDCLGWIPVPEGV